MPYSHPVNYWKVCSRRKQGCQSPSMVRNINHIQSFWKCRFQEVLAGDIVFETAMLPLELPSHPKFQTPNRLHLPVIRAVEVSLRCPYVGMPHQRRNGSKVIPFIQEGLGKGMPHHVGMNPLILTLSRIISTFPPLL
jgi:hypothetical protein